MGVDTTLKGFEGRIVSPSSRERRNYKVVEGSHREALTGSLVNAGKVP